MSKFLIILMFFLVSCNAKTVRNDLIFTDDMSFDEFKIKLEEYAINNPYPKIDD